MRRFVFAIAFFLAFTDSLAEQTSVRADAQPPFARPSAFAHYDQFNPKQPMQDWRTANDLMQSLSGHVGHVRGTPKQTPPIKPSSPENKS